MLHTGRVGSTVVARMLEEHPGIRWEGEIFERRLRENGRRVELPPFIDLRARIGSATRDGLRYGFETKHHYEHHGHLYDLGVDRYVERLERIGFDYFIEVRRKNYLRQIVSGVRLRHSGQSHVSVGDRVERSSLFVDPAAVPLGRVNIPLVERFAVMDTLHKETTRALEGRHALFLTFERDIEKDPQVAYVRICEFLGLEPSPVQVTLRRTNDAPLRDLVSNFDAIVEELSGTEYEWMLEAER